MNEKIANEGADVNEKVGLKNIIYDWKFSSTMLKRTNL